MRRTQRGFTAGEEVCHTGYTLRLSCTLTRAHTHMHTFDASVQLARLLSTWASHPGLQPRCLVVLSPSCAYEGGSRCGRGPALVVAQLIEGDCGELSRSRVPGPRLCARLFEQGNVLEGTASISGLVIASGRAITARCRSKFRPSAAETVPDEAAVGPSSGAWAHKSSSPGAP